MQPLAVVERHLAIPGAAQPQRARRDDVEDRPGVGLGPADRAQHLTRRRLPGERPGQFAVPLLQFREQSHVLDGDDGLVGEGLKQRDLLVRERIHLGAPKVDRAHCRPFPKQRNDQHRPVAELPSQGAALEEFLCLGLEISHVNGPPLEHGAPRDGRPADREQAAHGAGNRAMVSGHLQASPV